MRLLYFHQHFTTPDGSSGTRSYEFAKALIAKGHQVTMVCGRSDRSALPIPLDAKEGWHRGTIDGIDVIALPLSYSNRDSIARRLWTFLRFGWRSVMIALRHDYDVLFATSTPLTAAMPGIAASWLRRKSFIFEVRDLWPELPKAMGMKNPFLIGAMWLLEGLAYRSSVACIGLAPGIVEGIARRSGKGHPVALIPNGCDLGLFNPSQRGEIRIAGINPGDFVAGFTGAHGRANGLDAILDAAAVLKRRGVNHIKILFVGDGSEKARLIARCEKEGLRNVVFHEPMPRVVLAKLTASLGCGLMVLDNIPAFYRGTSPNKFFDYLSAGIPVISNYPGWIADMIRQHGCGIAVPPDDPAALAEAIQKISSCDSLRINAGQNSRRLGAEKFDRSRLAETYVAFIEDVGPSS